MRLNNLIKKIAPKDVVSFWRIKKHEKMVLKSHFEDHLIKQQTIQFYAKKRNLRIFVETGTYIGRMVKAQLPYFESIISVELSDDLYKFNKNKFKKEKKVTILHGDSSKILPLIVDGLSGEALFWLDGHFSSGLTAKGELNTPIIKELEIVLANKFGKCILIDDARLFDGTNDYPEFNELKSQVKKINPNAHVSIENDIIVIDNG